MVRLEFASSVIMPICFFFLFFVFLFPFPNPPNSVSDQCFVHAHYNASSIFMLHSHYTTMQELQIVNLIITDSNHIVSVIIHWFKFHFSYFRESLTPCFLLFPNFIFRWLLSSQMHYYLFPFVSLEIFASTQVQFNFINLLTLIP